AESTETDVAGYARGVNDCAAAVLEHHRNFVTHRVQKAPNVDVKDAPVLGFSSLIERTLPFNASIVKRNVELAEFIDDEADHLFNVGIFCDIGTNERRLAAKFFNFLDDLRTFFFSAPGQDYFCAGPRERDRRGFADTRGASS